MESFIISVILVLVTNVGKCAHISHGKITFPDHQFTRVSTTWKPRVALHSDKSEKRMFEDYNSDSMNYREKETKEGWNYIDTWDKKS